jgi:hypothetical protein
VVSVAGVTSVLVPLTGPAVLRLRLVAPVTDHLRVALAPLVIQEGLALKL